VNIFAFNFNALSPVKTESAAQGLDNEAPRSKLRGIKAEFRRSSPCLRAAQALAPRVIPAASRRRAIAWATVRCRVFRRRRIKFRYWEKKWSFGGIKSNIDMTE
jgi:hypothetical protein